MPYPMDKVNKDEMDEVYPTELPESMSKEMAQRWTSEQLGSVIAPLQSMPTYQDDSAQIWEEEQAQRIAILERSKEMEKEHKEIKIFLSSRMSQAERVANQSESI